MNTFLGAGRNVGPKVVSPSVLHDARITYVEGYCLDTEYSVDSLIAAAEEVHAGGGRFAITLSDLFCVDRHRDSFMRLLQGSVDICFGNDDEVKALFETDDLESALNELEKRCPVVAITSGAQGSILIADGERVSVRAVSANVVDTTGAGDLFAAGVLRGLAAGWPIERCGQMGSRAAGAVISQMGARLSRQVPSA